ncbi:50S ribosomal protein L25 [Patescibacteria group bacterium]|nr:50S ribosomal protein L25 [Patescibacteria group bacterium]
MAKKDELKLTAEKRTILGRKAKTLRREGVLPANIYGKKVKSLAVQTDLKSFLAAFKKTGETSVVKLKVKGEKTPRPVLIHNIQFDPVSDQPLHADFYQVDLKVKVTTEVPIELVGESPATKEKIGILIQPLTDVEVEALPTELPDKLELDISSLKEVGNAVAVVDLKIPKEVKVLTPEKEILAKIEPLAKEEVALPPEEEVPEEEKPSEEEAKAPPEEAKTPLKEEKPGERELGKEKTEKK